MAVVGEKTFKKKNTNIESLLLKSPCPSVRPSPNSDSIIYVSVTAGLRVSSGRQSNLCFGNRSHRCFNRWHKDLVLQLLKVLHIYGKKRRRCTIAGITVQWTWIIKNLPLCVFTCILFPSFPNIVTFHLYSVPREAVSLNYWAASVPIQSAVAQKVTI